MSRGSARPKNTKYRRGVILLALVSALFVYLYRLNSLPKEPQAIERLRSTPDVAVLLVDPAKVELCPVIAESRDGETFEDMMERLKPDAAINGTFFDENLRPLGDILADGRLINKGHYPNALAVTNSNRVAIIRGTRRKINWTGYKAGIAGGPRLVTSGKVHLDPTADGFRMASLRISARRSGVGITNDGKLLLVCTHRAFTLREFADLMIKYGAVEALNFDGGAACGLYMDGKVLASPALRMASILAVYKKRGDTNR